MSVFEVLARNDDEGRQAATRSMLAARARADESFVSFLAGATNEAELTTRLAAIADDLAKMVREVTAEYDYNNVDQIYNMTYHHLAETKTGNLKTAEESEDTGICEGCGETKDVSKCPYCQSEICQNCATLWGEASGVDYPTCDCGEQWNPPPQPRTASEDNYWSESVDLPSNSDTGLGEPEPKIDKGKVPAEGLKAIEVPSERHPLEVQRITDTAEYNDEDFEVNTLTERIDAQKPLQPEFNAAPNTDTWSGTSGLADPVTSSLHKYEQVKVG